MPRMLRQGAACMGERMARAVLVILHCCVLSGSAFKFRYKSFQDVDGLLLQGSVNATNAGTGLWLTQVGRNESTGRILFQRPLSFKPTNASQHFASFNTSFSFQIVVPRNVKLAGPDDKSGDGLAFFIAPTSQLPSESNGMLLGLAQGLWAAQPDRHLFAVEFDTYKNAQVNDTSDNHIGVDINGLASLAAVDTSNFSNALNLQMDHNFTAWVGYDSLTQEISVWAINNSGLDILRPSSPCVTLTYDLSTVFLEEMYVGLSASCGQFAEGHIVYSWDFSMEDVQAAPSSPLPAPKQSTFRGGEPLSASSDCCRSRRKLIVIVGAALSAVCVLLVAACFALILKKKMSRTSKLGAAMEILQLASDCSVPRYKYNELRRATNGFAEKNKIGEGASGDVFKGLLPNGSMVAIKRLKDGLKRETEFSSEIRIIIGIRHRNLLQLRGWCYDKGEAMLVYDYMPNGSLDRYRSKRRADNASLDSEKRFNILKGVAAALEYLHNGLGGCVLHRDVKAGNVLLTENFDAMLGDFGLARLISRDEVVTMTAAGTPGYVAPEVIYTGKATDKADVYSFGVLALEVACGRRVMDGSLPPQEMRLVDWVWLLHQSNKLMVALDMTMFDHGIDVDYAHADHVGAENLITRETNWRCVLHVGLLCCHPFPENRPNMRQVNQALQDSTLLPLPSSQPLYPSFFPFENSNPLLRQFSLSGGSSSISA